MKPTIRFASLVLLSTATLLSVACGSKVVVVPSQAAPAPAALVAPAPSQVVVTTVPPTPALPQDAVASVSPGPDYAWVAGYYNWVGDHYVWMPGNWVRTPRPAATWIAGHWQSTNGGYSWVPGHWQ